MIYRFNYGPADIPVSTSDQRSDIEVRINNPIPPIHNSAILTNFNFNVGFYLSSGGDTSFYIPHEKYFSIQEGSAGFDENAFYTPVVYNIAPPGVAIHRFGATQIPDDPAANSNFEYKLSSTADYLSLFLYMYFTSAPTANCFYVFDINFNMNTQ